MSVIDEVRAFKAWYDDVWRGDDPDKPIPESPLDDGYAEYLEGYNTGLGAWMERATGKKVVPSTVKSVAKMATTIADRVKPTESYGEFDGRNPAPPAQRLSCAGRKEGGKM